MMDPSVVRRVQAGLVGASCDGIDCNGGLLQLAFGTQRLAVQSCWRLSHGDVIVASGSRSHDVAKAILVSSRVKGFVVVNAFHDLLVEFENGARLETFADAPEYEHWNYFGGGVAMVVAGPGRLWSSF